MDTLLRAIFLPLLAMFRLIQCDPIIISLNGNKWTTTCENKSISTAAVVPGGIYSDLRRANILKEDIYYRMNDINYRWVSKTGWTYSTEFVVKNKHFLEQKFQFLVFHGIDTVAKVFLNDEELGATNNMFVRYKFNVKDKIKSNNKLSVVIESPILESAKISKSLDHPAPPECTPGSYRGECHINVLRKMQASFAWDWGPAFPSVGLWRDIELESYQNAKIRDVMTDIVYYEDFKCWHITIRSIIETSISETEEIRMKLSSELILKSKRTLKSDKLMKIKGNKEGEIEVTSDLVVPEDDIELWWPNGYGDQPLYDLELSLASAGNELSTKAIKIGFRTIKLIQKPVDPNALNKGLTFYFEVNKVPIFAKGSNLIPVDILPEYAFNESTIQNLLVSSKEANMNMLRVWGGGIYMSDYFYQLCDELGILIWQDMMFACNTYPVMPEFLDSIKTEITQNVRRLQHHPSVGVWAGNNEMEGAMRQHWYPFSNEALYFKEYADLYVDTLKPIIVRYDPERSYLTSSPTNGVESEKAKYAIHSHPYSSKYGDTHNYNYYSDLWKTENVFDTRFCSEFGIQSMPQLSTLQKVSEPSDLVSLRTDFFASRQHLGNGNGILEQAASHQFVIQNITLEYFIYLSQIYQAGSIKTITEELRRNKDTVDSQGNGMSMGALYWQLNDVWQAPTWSSLDYEGNWKMLHFFARKFFSPVLISPKIRSKNVDVIFISDLRQPLHNVIVNMEVFEWDNEKPVKTFKVTLPIVKENSVTNILSKPLSKICSESEKAKYYIKVSAVQEKPEFKIEANYLFLEPIKASTQYLREPLIKIKSVQKKELSNIENEFSLILTCNTTALFTWLYLPNVSGKWSDNGFVLLGDYEVKFITTNMTLTTEYLEDNLRVTNVEDDPSYQKPRKLIKSSATLPSIQWMVVIVAALVHLVSTDLWNKL